MRLSIPACVVVDRYEFHPRDMLRQMVSTAIHLAGEEEFVAALAARADSAVFGSLRKAATLLRRLRLMDETRCV